MEPYEYFISQKRIEDLERIIAGLISENDRLKARIMGQHYPMESTHILPDNPESLSCPKQEQFIVATLAMIGKLEYLPRDYGYSILLEGEDSRGQWIGYKYFLEKPLLKDQLTLPNLFVYLQERMLHSIAHHKLNGKMPATRVKIRSYTYPINEEKSY